MNENSVAYKARVMPVEDIPSGTDISLDMVKKFMPPFPYGWVAEFGSGQGNKTEELWGAGYYPVPFDFNLEAIMRVRDRTGIGHVADLTRIEDLPLLASYLEAFDGVFAHGLLCNVPEWRKVLQLAHLFTRPGGYLFIADVQRADEPNWAVVEYFAENGGEEACRAWVEGWKRRYTTNAAIGLPYGQFVVAKPGPNKQLEWGSVDELRGLRASDEYERDALHLPIGDLFAELDILGWITRHVEEKVWFSRDGDPLAGFVVVCQKGNNHVYHPWKRVGDDGRCVDKPSPYDPEDYNKYVENLRKYCPFIDVLFPGLQELVMSDEVLGRVREEMERKTRSFQGG